MWYKARLVTFKPVEPGKTPKMSLPKSMLAFGDCKELYDRALESVESGKFGARVRLPSLEAANYFRMRMNQARVVDRAANAEIYVPGDPLYKASSWDSLMVRIKRTGDGVVWVYAEPHGIETGEIEEVLDPHEAMPVLASPPRQLALPSPEMVVLGIRRRV